jgi:hypothetical protein
LAQAELLDHRELLAKPVLGAGLQAVIQYLEVLDPLVVVAVPAVEALVGQAVVVVVEMAVAAQGSLAKGIKGVMAEVVLGAAVLVQPAQIFLGIPVVLGVPG